MKKLIYTLLLLFTLFLFSSSYTFAADTLDDANINALRLKNENLFQQFRQEGIPVEKIQPAGIEYITKNNNIGISVIGFEFIININDISSDWFYDYTLVTSATDDTGNLIPWLRQKTKYDRYTGTIIEILETKNITREFFVLDILIHNYSKEPIEVPVYGTLIYTEKLESGLLTWANPAILYEPLEKDYLDLQIDNRNIGSSCQTNWYTLNPNTTEEISLIFVVDSDRKTDFLIEFGTIYNDLYNGEKNVERYFSLE